MLIQAYTYVWVENFNKIKAILNGAISDYVIDIQHVGSTAVPNLGAKPIIDIDVVYQKDSDFEKIKNALATLGYFHNGNQEVEGREVFKRNGQQKEAILDEIKHHLYVCKVDCEELQKHLLFRDYLQNDEMTREYYHKLKRNIAIEANQDKAKYALIKEQKATYFINYVVELSRLKHALYYH